MRRTHSFHPVFAPALSLVLLGGSAPSPAGGPDGAPAPATSLLPAHACAPVRGAVDARVTGIALGFHGLELRGKGTSAGDLPGAVQISMRKRWSRADTLRFTAKLRVETHAGTVVLQGDGSAVRSGVGSPLRQVESRLDVSKGSGGFATAAGGLQATGVADTGARRLVLEYTGSLCGP